MNNDYDSILKEKKKSQSKLSEISNENAKKPNYVIIDLFLITIIIVICYIVYFNTVLNGKNIILNDLKTIKDEYNNVIENLRLNYNIDNSYNFKGSIDILKNNISNKIEYDINNNGSNLYLNAYNDKINISYFANKNNNFIKSSNIGNNYIITNKSTINDYLDLNHNIVNNISKFLDNKNNYKKSFYLEDEKPIIKVEVNLNKDEINQIISNQNLSLKDEYNINITLLNNALSNKIVSVKVIVNNKSNDKRDVYLYSDNSIVHTNDKGVNEKIEILNNSKNFTLKYYKDDVLYSVLTGTEEGDSYHYLYQVIDSKYTIKLAVNNNSYNYNYSFDFNIDTDKKKYLMNIDIVGEYINSGVVDEVVSENISKDELNEDQQDHYNNLLNDLLELDLKDVFSIN